MGGRQARQAGGSLKAALAADSQRDCPRALGVRVTQGKPASNSCCSLHAAEANRLGEHSWQVGLVWFMQQHPEPSSRQILQCGSTNSHLSCSGRSDKCLALWSQSVWCSTCSWPDPAELLWCTLWRRCSCRGLSGCRGCHSRGSQSCRRYPAASKDVVGIGGGWGRGPRVGLEFRKGLIRLQANAAWYMCRGAGSSGCGRPAACSALPRRP